MKKEAREVPISEALRWLRKEQGVSQGEAAKARGADC